MIGIGLGWLLARFGVLAGLSAFGLAYNHHISKKSPAHMQAYVAFYVAFGCLVTLAGASLLDWRAAAWVLLCFVASGWPMMLGAMQRFDARQESELKEAQIELSRAGERIDGDE